MRKTKNLSRVLSMILAFCLSVALLPAQAFAATTNDGPTTWPAPDSHYTAPDKNPVYLMVDFTDEVNRPLSSRQMKKRKLGHEGLVPESKGSQAL